VQEGGDASCFVIRLSVGVFDELSVYGLSEKNAIGLCFNPVIEGFEGSMNGHVYGSCGLKIIYEERTDLSIQIIV
jgi:hypothetical protein